MHKWVLGSYTSFVKNWPRLQTENILKSFLGQRVSESYPAEEQPAEYPIIYYYM